MATPASGTSVPGVVDVVEGAVVDQVAGVVLAAGHAGGGEVLIHDDVVVRVMYLKE